MPLKVSDMLIFLVFFVTLSYGKYFHSEKLKRVWLFAHLFVPLRPNIKDAIARSLERTAVVRITLTEPPVGKRKQCDKDGMEMKSQRDFHTSTSAK